MEGTSSCKALVIGDLHFKEDNGYETNMFTTKLFEWCKTVTFDMVVLLGDTLDTHERLNTEVLTRAIKFFMKPLQQLKDVPMYVIVGNHDRMTNVDFLSDYHPFVGMEDHPKIKVVNTVASDMVCGMKFTFVPYVYKGRFREALDRCPGWEKSTAIFAHQEFKGAQMGAIKSADGDEWPEDLPLVISGHIHDFQILQSNLIYTGSPIKHTYGEGKGKYIFLFSFGPGLGIDKVDLGLPSKEEVEWTAEDLLRLGLPDVSGLDKFLTRIRISGTATQITMLKGVLPSRPELQGFKIKYETTDTKETMVSLPPRLSFRDAIRSELSSKSQAALALFDTIRIT